MKIIHALWSLGTGGTESMLADIVNEQVKEHDVYIIIVNDILSLPILNRINPKCKIEQLKDTTLSSAWITAMSKGQQPSAPEDYIEVEK